MKAPRLGYVAGLDGLRGLAILLVLAYHCEGLPGGFLGVDVFFVLSGFLITTLLLEERAVTGRISLRAFYERRARRLFPALAAVLALTTLFGLLAVADGKVALGTLSLEGVAACAFYIANLVRMVGHPLPLELTPMWSLAQEEQFYLVWPAILILTLRRGPGPKRLAVALASLALLVVGWRCALTVLGASHDRVYFGPDAHCDGLLLGAALAFARRAEVLRPLRRHFMPVALAVIVSLASVAGADHFYVAAVPIAEIAATALVWGIVDGSRLLSPRPLVWLGSVSYGVYVWQATVVMFFGTGLPQIAIAIAAGWASTRWIERRFRRPHAHKRTLAVALAAPSG